MKIIHFSDTHLGFNNYDKVNEAGVNIREQDFYDAFSNVIDFIIEEKADLVLHSGDFFHRPSPTNRALTFATSQLLRLSKHHIPMVILAGNHSTPKTSYTSPILKLFSTFENVTTFFNQCYETFDFQNITIHGLPHINDPEVLKQEIEKIKPIDNRLNILMLHTSIGKSYMEDLYGDSIFPKDKVAILNEFDYVALGHWHNFQKVKSIKNAWYSGSTERMSESEIGVTKGFCSLKIVDNSIQEPIFHSLKTRNWLSLIVKNCYEKTIAQIEEEIDIFKLNNNLTDSILTISLENIKKEQSFELSNLKLREKFSEVMMIDKVKRTFYQSYGFLENLEQENFENLEGLFSSFVASEVAEDKDKAFYLSKIQHYFKEIPE